MRRPLVPLEVVVFVVGSASLGAEIAAARLLAPYFGASTIVWANTIAIVLVALSAGYWLGGRLADRNPTRQGMQLVVLAAGVLLAVVPFVARPFLGVSTDALDEISAGAFLGSLLGVLILISVPVLLLGTAAPYAIRLSVERVEEAGRVAGRLYAISTVGSLAGTFLSALLLIPVLGTRRTFLVYALALCLVAVVGLGRRFAVVPVALAGLIALPVGTIKAADDGDRVLQEADTEYQYVRVLEQPDGDRALELNEGLAVHSLRRPGTFLTNDVWDGYLVLPFAARDAPPARIAILGNAAGTTARAYGHFFPQTEIDGVEIDGELHEIGRRWFDMRNPRLRTITEDARPFLRRTERRYDAIFVDAYRQPYIPFYLATREFFELARDRLVEGGVVVVNVGHPEDSDELEKVIGATLAEVFPTIVRDPLEDTNTLLLATRERAGAGRLAAAARRLPADLRPVARAASQRLGPRLPGGTVYTDDKAPVEWLIDRSIVEYAADSE